MSFGLTQQGKTPPPSKAIVPRSAPPQTAVAAYTVPETQLAIAFDGPGRIQKHQLICRKCRKPVERTEQFKEHAGARSIINCAYFCHGETGMIRVCTDQWSYTARMLVLEGLPELCDNSGKPLMIADSSPEPVTEKPRPAPGVIDIESEIVTDDLPPTRRLN